jgi:uncharacterized membrane protein
VRVQTQGSQHMSEWSQMSTQSARKVPAVDWHTAHKESLPRGDRAADILRNGMGSWKFVGGFVAFMIVWAFANSLLTAWDPFPFILLNLFLSMLAGLQGAILLISAKRQDGIAAALAQHDYATNLAAKTDIDTLLEINHRQLELIAQLQEQLTPVIAHATLLGPPTTNSHAADRP